MPNTSRQRICKTTALQLSNQRYSTGVKLSYLLHTDWAVICLLSQVLCWTFLLLIDIILKL